MDISFTVETTNGTTWTATCADPVLECEGKDIIEASKKMAKAIEQWFIKTFNTTRKVVVEVPTIKAKVKASVSVRAETPLDEFDAKTDNQTREEPDETIPTVLKPCAGCGMEILVRETETSPLCQSCAYERDVSAKNGVVDDDLTSPKRKALPAPKVNGPCAYISDGKGVLPVGACEAVSSDPSDTPGLKADVDGICGGDYEGCTFYKQGGRRMAPAEEYPDDPDIPESDDYGPEEFSDDEESDY